MPWRRSHMFSKQIVVCKIFAVGRSLSCLLFLPLDFFRVSVVYIQRKLKLKMLTSHEKEVMPHLTQEDETGDQKKRGLVASDRVKHILTKRDIRIAYAG